MRKYIHIGFPKNFSTSLQRDYFSMHPELFHLGIGLNNSNLGYYNSEVEKTFEVYFKTCKSFKYQTVKDKIKNQFDELFNSVDREKYKAVGVSAEHLSFSFSYDSISSEEKAQRLYDVFGSDTTIVMIVRNQMDLIKSLYRESVRVGFIGDFEEYIKLVYKYQDRNFVYDFRFDLMFDCYSKLFGKDNVKVLFFEDYRGDNNQLNESDVNCKLFEDLNKALNLSNPKMELKHYNEALPKDKILIKSQFNKGNRHDLGNHLLESAEKHRIVRYLEEDLEFFELEKETYSDVIAKRECIDHAINSEESLDLIFDQNIAEFKKLKDFYRVGNQNLEKILNISLPEKYLN